jgi:hypothetical protein
MAAGDRVGLPPRPFFYTLDQLATMLEIEEQALKRWLHYEGRSIGPCPRDKILVHNLAPEGETPVWRALDRNFIRWLRFKGLRYHERGYVK